MAMITIKLEGDLDLHADDIEQDFFNTPEELRDEGFDLYDDVTTNSGKSGEGEATAEESPSTPNNLSSQTSSNNDKEAAKEGIQGQKHHQVYVGNLTWWTSDKNIQDILEALGVNDFVDVKFFENRTNGQSKGFCTLTVGSEGSLKLIHDKLPKTEIHGKLPVVTPPSKQALYQFEAQSKITSRPSQGSQGNHGNMNMNTMRAGSPMRPMHPQTGGMGFGHGMMPVPMRAGPGGPMMMGGPPHRIMGPQHRPPGNFHPQQQQRPQWMPPHPNPGPPQHGRGPPPGMNLIRHPHHHNTQQFPPPQPMPPRVPMHPPMMDSWGPPPCEWNRPPMNNYPPPHWGDQPSPLPSPGPGPMQASPLRGGPPAPHMMNGAPPLGAPAPHMNPAFFNSPETPGPQQGGSPPTLTGSYVSHGSQNGVPQPNNNNYSSPIKHPEEPAISEAEFEELLGRNKTVSSSAINKAVNDAGNGEFASAIETLVTAISLIKQAKIANHDRCKLLVSSLENALHGIETKSYGGRDRSRSRERDRQRRSRRNRSRSRELDYGNRGTRQDSYPPERSRSPRVRECREGRESSSSRYQEEKTMYRERDIRELGRGRTREVDRNLDCRERERERELPERFEMHRATRH